MDEYQNSSISFQINPYIPVNKMFIQTVGEFSAYEKLIYVCLMSHWNTERRDEIFPSIQRLCDLSGLSNKTVIQALKGLEEKKMIIKKNDYDGNKMKRRNKYTMLDYETGHGVKTQPPKDTIPYKEIIDYLNAVADKKYRHTTEATKKSINGRWNEGYRLDDFKHVIDVKTEEWKGTKWEKHLCPETLFRPSHFEKYLNQQRKGSSYGANKNSGGYEIDLPF